MPAGGDVIELVHEQAYLGQQINNVYYFEAAVVDASMIDLATWFETNVVPIVKSLQQAGCDHLNLRLRNLFNLAETYEEPLSGSGTGATPANDLPSFMALQIRLDHVTGAVRPGFKRISGIHEGQLTDGLVAASEITKLDSLGALLVNPPSVANADWAHVVVGRVCETLNPVLGEVPRCLKYRLPQDQVELVVGYPVTAESYTQPTTQNSRKWYT